MPDYKQRYKNPRQGFGDANHRRVVHAYRRDQTRREVRTQAFDKNRELLDVTVSPQRAEDKPVAEERMKKLLKWKEERERRRKLEDAKKKPVFKVGIVHHSFYSPVTKSNASATAATAKVPKQAKPQNDVQKRVTRATEKRLLAKAKAGASKQALASPKNAVSKSLTKHPVKAVVSTSKVKKQKSFAPINHEFRPPSGLPKMPLFGLVSREQTPSEKGDFFVQDILKELKAHDTNDKDVSQEPSAQIRNSNITQECVATKSKNSISPKISPNQRTSRQRISDEPIINDDSDNVTFQLNETITLSLSPDEQTRQSFSQEEKSSLNNSNMKTPLQKTPLISGSSKKENCIEDLITFSPYLTISRGKSNARKEQQVRLGIGRSPSDEIPTKETVMKNLNISIEEEERTAQYFKLLLRKETGRLKELCEKWMDIRLGKDIPEDAMCEISQAVGQTNLLINKKFERFHGLVLDCETGRGEMLVTCRDLQGFWDMTYMEVEDCDSRFEKLEERRKRDWREEHRVAVKTVPVTKKRMPVKRQTVSAKPSSLRSLILAARQKKMGEPSNADSFLQDKNINKGRVTPPLSSRKSVIFKENTDTLHSMERSKCTDNKSTPSRRNSSRASSVQKVQLSDASKRMKSPFTIMKISQMCKTPEIQLDDTISYVNSAQTPGKSILKKSEEVVVKDVRMKSAHKVNFDDHIVLTEVPVDEETKIRLSLAAALNRIDNLDLDDLNPTECINAEKKLIFETVDSDASDNSNDFEWMADIQRETKKEDNKSRSLLQNVSSSVVGPLKNITSPVSFKVSPPNDGSKVKSRSFLQNVSSSSTGPLKNITSAVSFKESSPNDDLKVKSRRKSLRRRVRSENMIDNGTVEIPATNNLCTTPASTDTEASVASETISNVTHMKQEHNTGVRVLRNRTIANDTPKTKRMTPRKSISKKENKSPVKSNSGSLLKLSQNDENKCMQSNEDNVIRMNENIDKKRRSTRKSVVFNVDDTCLACTENKPVLPMTPHSKHRSKMPSRQSRGKHALDEDLILWETPERLPSRVTRSHMKN